MRFLFYPPLILSNPVYFIPTAGISISEYGASRERCMLHRGFLDGEVGCRARGGWLRSGGVLLGLRSHFAWFSV